LQRQKQSCGQKLATVASAGHYEVGNLKVVCQFINFWKGDSDNAEFQMLLMLVVA
jgi:hypothetical protein